MSKKAEPRLCDPASWLLLATGRVLAAFVLLDMSVSLHASQNSLAVRDQPLTKEFWDAGYIQAPSVETTSTRHV